MCLLTTTECLCIHDGRRRSLGASEDHQDHSDEPGFRGSEAALILTRPTQATWLLGRRSRKRRRTQKDRNVREISNEMHIVTCNCFFFIIIR